MADIRKVPSVPNVDDAGLRNFLSAVREALNAFTAAGGSASTLKTSTTFDGITGLPINLVNLLDMAVPPTPTGLAVQGMRVNNFVTWDVPPYANHNFTEIWRAPALLDAVGMAYLGVYTINTLGTVGWVAIGAVQPVITALVNLTQYIITALGTMNWNSIGVPVSVTPVIGTVFTYNNAAITGTGGAVLVTAMTRNAAIISGSGGAVQFAPVLSTAVLAGTSNGHMFVDSVDPGSVFAYWIYFVSNANVKSAVNLSVGVIGATSNSSTGATGWNITAENMYAIKAWIAQADIMDAAITNAKISGIIQSDNYNGSNLGWSLDKTGGNLNLNQLTIRDGSGAVILQSSAGGIDYSKVIGTTRPTNNATANQSDTTTNGAIASAATTAQWSGIPAGTGKAADNATVGAAFDSNITGKITSTNVSTYIANVAIQTAQIADLAVNTLQIAGKAVTIPDGASSITGIASVVLDSLGYPVYIMAELVTTVEPNATASPFISVSGYGAVRTVSTTVNLDAFQQSHTISIMYKFTPTAGARTYTLGNTNWYNTITSSSIIVIGVKK